MNNRLLSSDHNTINSGASSDAQIQHAITETFSADKTRNESFLKNNVLKLPEAKVIFLDKDYDRLIPSFIWDHQSYDANAGYIEENGLRGFIDRTGKETTPPQYMNYPHYHVLAVVQDAVTGKYGTVDEDGNIYNACKYDRIGNSVTNDACIDGKRGRVGANDTEILPFIYDDIFITQGDETDRSKLIYAVVRIGDKVLCIDGITKQEIPLPEEVKKRGAHFFGKNDKYGFITHEGYYTLAEFDFIESYVKGQDKHLVHHAGERKKLTFDNEGNKCMEVLSEEMQLAYDERYPSVKNPSRSTGYIDHNSPQPTKKTRPKDIHNSHSDENYEGVYRDNKRGIMDENTAEVILPAKFDEIHLHYGSHKAWGRMKQWKALVEVSLPKKATP